MYGFGVPEEEKSEGLDPEPQSRPRTYKPTQPARQLGYLEPSCLGTLFKMFVASVVMAIIFAILQATIFPH